MRGEQNALFFLSISAIDSSVLESCHSDEKRGRRICVSFWDSRITKSNASSALKASSIRPVSEKNWLRAEITYDDLRCARCSFRHF